MAARLISFRSWEWTTEDSTGLKTEVEAWRRGEQGWWFCHLLLATAEGWGAVHVPLFHCDAELEECFTFGLYPVSILASLLSVEVHLDITFSLHHNFAQQTPWQVN